MAKIVERQRIFLYYICPVCHWQPLTPAFTSALGWHCPNDGTRLVVQEKQEGAERVCGACLYPVWIGARYCVHCGGKLEDAAGNA